MWSFMVTQLCSFIYTWLLSCYNGRGEWLWQRPCGWQHQKYLLSGSLQKKLAALCPRLSVYDSSPMIVVCNSAQDPGLNIWTFKQLRKLAIPFAASGENLRMSRTIGSPEEEVQIEFVWRHSGSGISGYENQYILFNPKLAGIGFCCLQPKKLHW